MSRLVSAVLTALWAFALIGGYPHPATAQDKAQIIDVFKGPLAVDDPKSISVRQYDVPPGWVTPLHQHTGHMFLYIVEGSGAMETEGQVRAGAAGQVEHEFISQLGIGIFMGAGLILCRLDTGDRQFLRHRAGRQAHQPGHQDRARQQFSHA